MFIFFLIVIILIIYFFVFRNKTKIYTDDGIVIDKINHTEKQVFFEVIHNVNTKNKQ